MIRHAFSALAAALSIAAAVPALAAPAGAIPASKVPPIVYRQRTLPNGLLVLTSLDRATPM